MPNKFHIVAGAALALTIVHDLRTRIEATKNARLFIKAAEAYQETQEINEAQIQYLCHMLDEHDVPVNEFDLIALNYHL